MQYMIYWLEKSWQFLFDKLELYSSTALHCTCSCFCSSWADVIFCLLPPWPPTFLPPTQLTNPLLPGKGYTLLPLLLPRQPHLPGRITRPIFNMTSLILLLFQFCMHVLAHKFKITVFTLWWFSVCMWRGGKNCLFLQNGLGLSRHRLCFCHWHQNLCNSIEIIPIRRRLEYVLHMAKFSWLCQSDICADAGDVKPFFRL